MNPYQHKVLESERLWFREIVPGDAETFFRLNSDPEVIKYTGDRPFKDAEEAKQFIVNYDQYRKYGVGRWCMLVKGSDQILGWCGLKYSPELDEYDIGYRLFRDQWNKGFATEAAKACIRFGFDIKNIDFIVGRAMKVNTASIRVLSKSGLTYWKDDACGEADGVIYKIEKSSSSGEPSAC